MNRRRFFGMLAGVLGALALPVPTIFKRNWIIRWSKKPIVGIFPKARGTSHDNASLWVPYWHNGEIIPIPGMPVPKLRKMTEKS